MSSKQQPTILSTFQDVEEKGEAAVADRQGPGPGEERQPSRVKAQTGTPASAGGQLNQAEC